MDFSDAIKLNKPKISEGSLKTYNSLLRSVYNNLFLDTTKGYQLNPSPSIFSTEYKKVLNFLSKKTYSSRKTYLAALYAIAPDIEEYKSQMMEDIKTYNDEVEKSEMTDKLSENEITKEEMQQIEASLKKKATTLMKEPKLTIPELMELQNYIILSLYHGHIQPRRAQDFINMKYKSSDPSGNYMDLKKNTFVFNIYKTAKKNNEELRGTQEITIPKDLKKILTKWISFIPVSVDYLLFNAKLEPLTNVTLNQRLNSIFGGNKSINSLRHFYLQQNHKDTVIANEKLAQDMTAMASSTKQAKIYIKINEKTI
jgi:hypothetical protein